MEGFYNRQKISHSFFFLVLAFMETWAIIINIILIFILQMKKEA